jgi:hypothetical protein
MSGNGNGIATAGDVRQAYQKAREFEPSEVVKLPKLGKNFLLRRPTFLWFATRGHMPTTLASKFGERSGEKSPLTVGDLRALGEWWFSVVSEVVVQPKVSLSPGPEEISVDEIDIEDVKFIYDWAYGIHVNAANENGEVQTETKSLSEFR